MRMLGCLRLGLLAAAFGAMGAMKLAGVDWERRLFSQWHRSAQAMRMAGAAETAGALMLACPATRRLGAVALAAESLGVLEEEVRHRNDALACIRGTLLLLAAMAALPRRA